MFDETNLSFTTTALARPDILHRTYSSFSSKLRGINLKNLTLHINVDPIPNDMGAVTETIKVAKLFFKDVNWHIAPKPNYSSAVKWCWNAAMTKFIFHLEDDWELAAPFDMEKIWNKFEEDDRIVQVLLKAYAYEYEKFCLNPSVIIRRCYSIFGQALNDILFQNFQADHSTN